MKVTQLECLTQGLQRIKVSCKHNALWFENKIQSLFLDVCIVDLSQNSDCWFPTLIYKAESTSVAEILNLSNDLCLKGK